MRVPRALTAAPGAVDAVARLLLCSALHTNKETRQAAQAACRRLVAAQVGVGMSWHKGWARAAALKPAGLW